MNRLFLLLSHYQLAALTLAFAAGILLHDYFSLALRTYISFTALLLTAALFCFRKDQAQRTLFFLLLSATTLGLFHAGHFADTPLRTGHIYSQITQEEDAVLTGTLHSMPLFDGSDSTLLVDSHTLRRHDQNNFSSIHGLVRLQMKGSWPTELLPGEELVIRTELSRPYRFGNTGSFDYPSFLASRDIRVIGRIQSPAHIHPLETESSWPHSLRYLPERTRLAVRELLDKTFPPQQAGIYRALLIGDRSAIDPKTLEDFKASGCMHILAISGLHLSLLASALFIICYWLARRSQYLMLRFSARKLALLATIPPLCSYALLAGAQTPVLRSLIMVLIFILAFCVNRQRSLFTALACAALIILLWNPLSLTTVSFQLSFMAVASLILILPGLTALVQQKTVPDRNSLQRFAAAIMGWVCAALLVSVAATIGTAPLLIHAFNRLSTVGPVANLFLEPLLCLWSLPLGLLAIPLLFISPQGAEWILHLGGYGISTAIELASVFGNTGFSNVWLPTPPILIILLYYLTLALCFTGLPQKKTIPLFLAVCALFFFPLQALTERFATDSEITFLDVGQGSSSLLSFPGGKKILIDGGGASSAKFNVGEQLIAPYLWHRGITNLEAIVITHADTDHYSGIPFLLQRFHPKTLWVNGSSGHDQGYDNLLSLAHDLNITIKTPDRNEVLLENGETKLVNLENPFLNKNRLLPPHSLSSNDKSLILQFRGQNLSCLFPGDISQQLEHKLIAAKTALRSSILLSPHHGSKNSNSGKFMEAVHPDHIIVSAGRFRPLLFPSLQVREYCRDRKIPLLNTAEIGAVTVIEQEGRVKISSFFTNTKK
ncbi:MAG: DNA internalization-related competence protein ComEC/Rec2 [Proteobacteria bacterium]|nr:DNA internalization-related competence protein ComEC/Rec2 [Pseudomonadota bacterium]